jgi:hypothetical protein
VLLSLLSLGLGAGLLAAPPDSTVPDARTIVRAARLAVEG